MLALQCLQCLQLPPSSLLVLVVSLLDARRNLLELLDVALHSGSRGTQRFLILRLALVRMRCQVLEDEVGMPVEQ